MEDIDRLRSSIWHWIELGMQSVQSLAPETVATICVVCAFAALIFALAWCDLVRRNRVLKSRIGVLTEELARAQEAYETEVKWRLAADKVFGRTPASSPSSQEQSGSATKNLK